MVEQAPTSAIDDLIQRFERRLAAARAVRELLAEDREFAMQLVQELSKAPPVEAQDQPRAKPSGNGQPPTHFSRIRSLFESTGNHWLATPEIVSKTGLPRGSVGAILHNLHADSFEKRDKAGTKKTKEWRLKTEGAI